MELSIRLATRADLAAINFIYNHYVPISTCTYQTDPSSPAEREAWFLAHDDKYPVTLAELDGRIVGWGSLSRFHPRAAYGRTVEDSVYVHPEFLHRGIGRALLRDLLERAAALEHHAVIALISADQAPSVALHRELGFVEAGHLREVGYKFDRWLDVIYMQRMV